MDIYTDLIPGDVVTMLGSFYDEKGELYSTGEKFIFDTYSFTLDLQIVAILKIGNRIVKAKLKYLDGNCTVSSKPIVQSKIVPPSKVETYQFDNSGYEFYDKYLVE